MQDVLQVLFKLTCIAATGSSERPAGGSAVMQQKKSNFAYVFTKCLECVHTVTGLTLDSSARFKKKKRWNITTTTNSGYYYFRIETYCNIYLITWTISLNKFYKINVVYSIQVFKIQKQERIQRDFCLVQEPIPGNFPAAKPSWALLSTRVHPEPFSICSKPRLKRGRTTQKLTC